MCTQPCSTICRTVTGCCGILQCQQSSASPTKCGAEGLHYVAAAHTCTPGANTQAHVNVSMCKMRSMCKHCHCTDLHAVLLFGLLTSGMRHLGSKTCMDQAREDASRCMHILQAAMESACKHAMAWQVCLMDASMGHVPPDHHCQLEPTGGLHPCF
jgi:hypothetical protein